MEQNKMTDNQQIAQIILAQLGGNKFLAMTGAKQLVAVEKGLQFKLPARFAKNGITCVIIKLNSMDLYDVTFGKIVKYELKEIAKVNSIYADMLQEVFTEQTGLDTHL